MKLKEQPIQICSRNMGKKYMFPSHQEYLMFTKSMSVYLFVSLEENSRKKMSHNSNKALNFRFNKKI